MSTPAYSARSALAGLAAGAAGAALFLALGLPLAFLLGSLAATAALALAGLDVRVPPRLRLIAFVILGIYAGQAITPDLLARVMQWPLTMAAMLALVAVTVLANTLYFRRIGGFDRATALFASMPGGLSQLLLTAGEAGADDRRVALTQILRIVTIIYAAPVLLVILEPSVTLPGGDLPALPQIEPALAPFAALVAAVAAGIVAARGLRLPQPLLLGPLLGVGACQILRIDTTALPGESLMAVQFLLGVSIGAGFSGIGLRWALRVMGHGAVAMIVTIGLALAVTAALAGATGLDPAMVFLAFAPGGLPEMVLLAVTLDIDPAFVITHHVLRFLAIVVLLPWLTRRFATT